jgi:hypothetical protein
MLKLIAALMIAGQPMADQDLFAPGRTAAIFSTIGQSEWCPAGNVALDLVSGNYALTARVGRRACNDPELQRSVLKGQLEGEPLTAIRRAYRRAQTERLNACRNGAPPPQIIVDNGGRRVLVLNSGAATTAAPDELSCWTDAAHALHRALNEPFRSFHKR